MLRKLLVLFSLFCFFGICQSIDQCIREYDSLCFDSSCGYPLSDIHVNKPCTCVPEDIGAQYSECVNGSRQLYYFWRPPATCIGGVLPNPVDGIPCNLVCGIGTYLNTTTKDCQDCPAGSFGDGGGHTFSEWTEWPAQFRTFCSIGGSTTARCNPWRLLGETIDSGDNANLHYLTSVVEFRVNLVRTGSVSFRYRVSAEQGFDGLWFVINNLGYLFRSNTEWTTYTRTLEPGYYSIQWQYYKDRSVTSGEDRAQISSISITGNTFADISCELCPYGHYQSLPSSSECKQCPVGQFSDILGATECKHCPPGQTSFSGSSSCFFQRICNSSLDYTYNYTKCMQGWRTKQYSWIEPSSCNRAGAVLPPDETALCEEQTCGAGQRYDISTQDCVYCPPGTARSVDGTSCDPCGQGTAASSRKYYMSSWGNWNGFDKDVVNVTTGCKGDCFNAQGGWRLGQWFTDSGTSNGPDSRSWLSLKALVYPGFNISFNYSLSCAQGNYLTVSLDDDVVSEFDCQQVDTTCGIVPFERLTIPVLPSTTNPHKANTPVSVTIQFTYFKATEQTDSACDRVLLSNVVLEGVASLKGGAATCTDCLAGTSSSGSAAMCSECSTGTFSGPNFSTCLSCPEKTFADSTGSQACVPCNLGTVNPSSTSCKLDCSTYSRFDLKTNQTYAYNLSLFSDIEVPHVYAENDTATSFVIYSSLCGFHPKCVSIDGTSFNSHSCLVSDSGTENINLGRAVNARSYMGAFLSLQTPSPYQGITFYTYFGDANCRLYVNFKCDPNAGVGAPSLISATQWSQYTNTCNYQINWSSSYGCPLCTEDNVETFETPCVDGVYEVVSYWTNSNCHGGYQLPPPQPRACNNVVKLPMNVIVVIVVCTLVTLVIALAFIFFLWYKNKKLYSDYQQLKARDVPMEDSARE